MNRQIGIIAILGCAASMCNGADDLIDPSVSSDTHPFAGAPREARDPGAFPAFPAFAEDPTALVNTSIGNNGDGTTFPGAAMPFGMVQLSPDTGLNRYASYDYKDTKILGFSQTHLSGVGCQTMGNFRFMPTTGQVSSSDPAAYGASFVHTKESASPGAYDVHLDSTNIDVALGATERTGWHRYTFPADAAAQNVLVEVGESNGYVFDGQVEVVGDDTVEGWLLGGNFCWETVKERYRIFFSAKFDRAASSFGTWVGGTMRPNERQAKRASGRAGAWLTFDPAGGRNVGVTVGLSYTSVEGARRNRTKESAGQSLESVRARAHDVWRDELQRMRVAGGTYADQRTYYSALYRSLLHPSIGSDVDGKYRDFRDTVRRGSHPYYQMFSLWDTYRSQNQLVALLHPERAADMARSVLRIAEDGGWVPRWALGNGETNVMSGDPVTPWVVTLYRRGILDRDTAKKLFAALWRNATEVPSDTSIFRGRDGNASYGAHGYIGYENAPGYTYGDRRQAGSATLEYALADCSLALMARGLGEDDKAKVLEARCRNFEQQWDPAAESKGFAGFPRTRRPDGSYVDPAPYNPTKATGFHEGTAWQYQWLAQQDTPALFERIGGAELAQKRLDTFFDLPTLLVDPAKAAKDSWVRGAYEYHNNFAFNPNNEPDLHAPWMYAWTAAPWKTSAVLRAARTLFVDGPYGMPGNDDLGTISSWLVFGMAGFFEVAPGSGAYVLSAPMFEVVELRPEGGCTVRIEAKNASASSLQYVSNVRIGGRPWSKSWIAHEDLLHARTVRFALTNDPNATTWGTGAANVPPRLVDVRAGR
ncbi:GH92 family glycosyl hydrolase [Pendulispora albinea]|uniref:GH92 family glycosyl hydrolase n=1 Tax=Pendulispora albinea TaxID=2741071 RepID=A0ABZ2M8L2_9BACT